MFHFPKYVTKKMNFFQDIQFFLEAPVYTHNIFISLCNTSIVDGVRENKMIILLKN